MSASRETGIGFVLLRLLLVAAGVALFAYAGILLTRGEQRFAAVWLANALVVAVLFRSPPRLALPIVGTAFAANLGANLVIGDPWPIAAGLGFANAAEVVFIFAAMTRLGRAQPDLSSQTDLPLFCLIGGIAGPLVSASAVALLQFAGVLPRDAVGLLLWTAADALGMVLFAPTVLNLTDALARWRRPHPRELCEWSMLFVVGSTITVAVFAQNRFPFLFLVTPVVVLHAFRQGSVGTSVSIVKISIIASVATWLGHGPIALVQGTLTDRLITLQTFLVVCFGLGLPIAAVLKSRASLIEDLRESRDFAALILENSQDAIFRIGLDGRCLYASPSARDLLGLDPAALQGQLLLQDFHPDDEPLVRRAFAALAAGKVDRQLVAYRSGRVSGDREYTWMEANCGLVREASSGTPREIVASIRNVDATKTLEEELRQARASAERAASAKAAFLANMSHEIRTPMNGVLGFTDLLLRGQIDEGQRRYLQLIQDSGRAMMHLLNDILDVSKIEAGRIELAPEPTNAAHIIDSAARLMRPMADAKQVEILTLVADDLPTFLALDPLRFRQVVLNLVGNAVKFTEQGSVRILLDSDLSTPDVPCLRLRVQDSGIGIPPDRHREIFEQFAQADTSTARRFGGTGLGLAITARLVEAMGGAVSLDSREGEGSTFQVLLPLVAAQGPAPSLAAPSGGEEPAPLAPSLRVLIVDDLDINRELLLAMVDRLGLRAAVAVGGAEAIAQVAQAEDDGNPFGLVLMDVQMPQMDGLEAARRIRQAGRSGSELPIVAVTANAYAEDVADCLAAGMQGHIAKPITIDRLKAVIAEHAANPASADRDKEADCLPQPSDALWAIYRQRRERTMQQFGDILAAGNCTPEALAAFMRALHNLAGSAAYFGERDLGEAAGRLERALYAGPSDLPALLRPFSQQFGYAA